MDNIYNMKLHEKITIGNVDILRVAGGWIYTIYSASTANVNQTGWTPSSVFVPYNNEFDERPLPMLGEEI